MVKVQRNILLTQVLQAQLASNELTRFPSSTIPVKSDPWYYGTYKPAYIL